MKKRIGKPFLLRCMNRYPHFGYEAGIGRSSALLCTREFERITGVRLKEGEKIWVQLTRVKR